MPSTSSMGRYSTYSSAYSSYPSYRSSASYLGRTTSLDHSLYSATSSSLGGTASSIYTGYYSKRLAALPPRPTYSSITDTYKSGRSLRVSPARSTYNLTSNSLYDRDSRYSTSRYRESSTSRDSGYGSRLTSRDHSYDYANGNGDVSRRSSILRGSEDEDEDTKVKVSERIRSYESHKDPAEERLAKRRQRLGLSPTRDVKSHSPNHLDNQQESNRQEEENGNETSDDVQQSVSDLCRKYNSNLNISNGVDHLSELSGCSGGAGPSSVKDVTEGATPESSSDIISERKDGLKENGDEDASKNLISTAASTVTLRSKSPSKKEPEVLDRKNNTTLNRYSDLESFRSSHLESTEYVPYRLRDRRERMKERIAKRLASELEDGDSPPSRRRSPTGRSTESFSESNGLVGLRNIGNTCFLNSITQCLSNTRCLMEYLAREGYSSDINTTLSTMKGDLVKSFGGLLSDMWREGASDSYCAINTGSFKSQIQRFAPVFIGYAQHDAQEFLRKLLEGLHEDVNRVTVRPRPITEDIDEYLDDHQKAMESWKRYLRYDDSKIVDMFVGQLKSSLQCSYCGHRSVTFDPFWDLSLPIPSRAGQVRLSQCLDLFTKEEVLDGDERPTCAKCKERRKMTKSFSLQKFPKVLVLHLKRFSPHERWRGKLTCMVEFPLEDLDLSRYAASASISCGYRLIGVANHSGTALSGHYTSYCRHPYRNTWHEYNDSRVSSMSPNRVCSAEAYVLFYELNSY